MEISLVIVSILVIIISLVAYGIYDIDNLVSTGVASIVISVFVVTLIFAISDDSPKVYYDNQISSENTDNSVDVKPMADSLFNYLKSKEPTMISSDYDIDKDLSELWMIKDDCVTMHIVLYGKCIGNSFIEFDTSKEKHTVSGGFNTIYNHAKYIINKYSKDEKDKVQRNIVKKQ